MASASHKCTLPMTFSAPAGPQNLSVMSTMESGTGVGTHRQFVCLHAGPPYVNACKLIHVDMHTALACSGTRQLTHVDMDACWLHMCIYPACVSVCALVDPYHASTCAYQHVPIDPLHVSTCVPADPHISNIHASSCMC